MTRRLERSREKALQGDLAGFVEELSDAIGIDREDVRCLNRILAMASQGDAEGAVRESMREVELHPKSAAAHYVRGLLRVLGNDTSGGMEDFAKAIQLDPKYLRALTHLSLAKVKKVFDPILPAGGNADILESNPEDAPAYFNRASVRSTQGDVKGALADFTEVLRLDPKNVMAYFSRGYTKSKSGDREGAIKDYTAAIELDGACVEAYLERGRQREASGNPMGAIEDFTKASELAPEDTRPCSLRGATKEKTGDLDGAIADYTWVIELDPEDPKGYFDRGVAKWNKRDEDGAAADYTKTIELDPANAAAWLNLGLANRRRERLDDAVEDYTKALEIDPGFARAYFLRASAKESTGDKAGALEDYSKSIELDPTNSRAYASRGLLRWTKDVEGALADFAKAAGFDSKYESLRLDRQREVEKLKGAGVDMTPPKPARRAVTVGRNDPCPCGSGKKYKRCCAT